jgi:hypothetical protein
MAYGMAWLRGPGQDQVAQLTVSALVVVAPHCDAYDLAEQFVPWNRQLASCGEGSTPFGSLGGHTPMMGMRPAGLMTSAIALVTQCGTSLLKSLSERGLEADGVNGAGHAAERLFLSKRIILAAAGLPKVPWVIARC